MNALIVANGQLPEYKLLVEAVRSADFVLAADGGANRLLKLGMTCDAILGDFDSLLSDILADIPRIEASDQNFTDLDKSVSYLIGQGAKSIIMTGVTGLRLDHTFGALSTLAKYGRKIDLSFFDNFATTRLVVGSIEIDTLPGQTISLLPITPSRGINTTGLRWQLNNETLCAGARDGISNEAISEKVTVDVLSGDLAVYIHYPSH
jgi:thiamine pyrophosphokinase